MCTHIYAYMYIHIYIHICIYTYIHIYMYPHCVQWSHQCDFEWYQKYIYVYISIDHPMDIFESNILSIYLYIYIIVFNGLIYATLNGNWKLDVLFSCLFIHIYILVYIYIHKFIYTYLFIYL
jgi:hypothetical protein